MRKRYLKSILKKLEYILNDYTIKKKLIIMYVFCVIVPLVITDSVILGIISGAERKLRNHEMQKIADAVEYSFFSQVDAASKMAKSIYTSKYIDEYLNYKYTSELEYVTRYQEFFKNTLIGIGASQSNMHIKTYVDNNTIINGGEFQYIDQILDKEWYSYMKDNNLEHGLFFEYDENETSSSKSKRKILYFQRMNFYKKSNTVLVIELDYRTIINMLENMNYDNTIFICDGDKIVLSNGKNGEANKDFAQFKDMDSVGYSQPVSIYGKELNIYVLSTSSLMIYIFQHLPLLIVLMLSNVLLPFCMVRLINHSFTVRIHELSEVFNKVDEEHLEEIKHPKGQDEIGILMRNYNKMAQRVNSLIQIVYKNYIKEQEITVARQNAELHALHSQINPHFLFNALESIRMHSILKNEIETADMVQKLAVMQRQYVEWQEDLIQIEREMDFVEAYLGLQKYRFGERLSYELDVQQECKKLEIPKLTIVSFVENACIHGIESKTTAGWIFVRIYKNKDMVCLEIEDTGNGMESQEAESLLERMREANINMLNKKGRVGIVNACLRLKMITNDKVQFDLESEPGVGTMIQICIPCQYVQKEEEDNVESLIGG